MALYPQDPRTIYAGTSDRIFKSSDGGSSWSAVNIGPSPDASREMAIDPQTLSTLYASTYTKLFKSSDGGSSWSPVNVLRIRSILALAVDPQTPTTVYVGTNGDNLFRSTDGGSSWSSVGPVSTQTVAFDLQSPTTVYAGTDYALFKSIDGGASFSRTGLTVLGVYAVAVDPKVPTTLYAGTRDYSPNLTGVVKSTDGGASWSAANNGLGIQPLGRALAIDPLNPAIIYVGIAGRGVFKSTDGGMSWTGINTGLTNLSIYALAIDPMTPTILYAGTGAGVFVLEQQPNRAPLADAGPDQVVEATDAGGAVVTLDGSRSSDPDGDSLTFAWSWPSGTATGVRATVKFPLGTTTVTLTVSDSQGPTATDTADITVRDTTPPTAEVASPGDGATVSGTVTVTASASDTVGVAGVQLLLDGEPLGAEDTSEPYEVAWDTRTVPDGTHRLAARARDAAGNITTSATVTVTVANGPVPTLTLARSEETAGTLAPRDAWSETTSADSGVALSGDRAVYGSAAGATATFTFTGTGVRWIGVPCEVCGVANVWIDDARVATVDTFAPTRPATSTVVYTSPRLGAGSHTLVIEVTGMVNTSSGDAFVVVDAFEVTLDGAGLLPPISAAATRALGAL